MIIPGGNTSPDCNTVAVVSSISYINEEAVINDTVISFLAKPVTDPGMLSQGILGDRVNVTTKR